MRFLVQLLAILAFVSCGPKQTPVEPGPAPVVDPEGGESGQGEESGQGGEESGSGSEDPSPQSQRVPLQAVVTGVQPMTGIVLWNTSGSKTKDYVQLEFSYMLYNDVCKEKDVYDWSPMEKLLDEVSARGHQAVVRFRYTYPGHSCAVPDYIKEIEGYEARWAKADGRSKPDTEYPDWRCEELQRFHMEFHRRFAERYDKDPRLAFVETGFGHWAEYHVYDGLFIKGQTFPSYEFQAQFLSAMDEWFLDTPWLISIDASDGQYGPFVRQKELLNLRFGNFDDSFMCEDWDGYNWSCWKFFGQDRYMKAPGGGEFSYYSSYDQKHCLDPGGMYGRVFEDVVAKVHMTFIIGNDQPGKQTPERIKEAAMSMGYRFEIRDYRVDSGKYADILIANVGVAPIYRSAFVSLEGVRADFDLRELMPGDEKWVNITSDAITLNSVPTIECDHLVSGQKIEYQADVK